MAPVFSYGSALGRLLACGAALLYFSPSLIAQQVVVDFNGLANGEDVRGYYAGEKGSSGTGPGPNFGTTFGPDANSQISTTIAAGQTVLFTANPNSGAPAPIIMNVAGGFAGQLSFQYAAPTIPHEVTIYDGTGGTGNVLATQTLPVQPGTPLYNASSNPPVVIPFAGTAKSVVFELRPGASCLDNISFTRGQAPGLLELTTNAGILLPEFDPDVTSYTLASVVAEGVEAIRVTVRRAGDESVVSMSINDETPVTLPQNQSTAEVGLEGCTNQIKLRVETAGGNTRTYTIDVAREGCAEKVPGPPGPQGPAGPANVITGSVVYTFPKKGVLKIEDPAIKAESVILLQYVGGGNSNGLFAKKIVAGGFTAKGTPRRRFRYVIVN